MTTSLCVGIDEAAQLARGREGEATSACAAFLVSIYSPESGVKLHYPELAWSIGQESDLSDAHGQVAEHGEHAEDVARYSVAKVHLFEVAAQYSNGRTTTVGSVGGARKGSSGAASAVGSPRRSRR